MPYHPVMGILYRHVACRTHMSYGPPCGARIRHVGARCGDRRRLEQRPRRRRLARHARAQRHHARAAQRRRLALLRVSRARAHHGGAGRRDRAHLERHRRRALADGEASHRGAARRPTSSWSTIRSTPRSSPIATSPSASSLGRRRGQRVRLAFESTAELGPPPAAGYVRLPMVRGSWRIEPAPEGGSNIAYRCYSEPGGAIPAFLVRGAQQDSTLDEFERVLTRVGR